jgi:predicted transcriptional regulator
MHNDVMKRTTIMADEETLERLKGLARDRGVSFAEVAREALEAKAAEFRPKPTTLGMFDSGHTDTSELATEPAPPVS